MVRINAKYFRPAEVDLLLGNPSKAEKVSEDGMEGKKLVG